MAIKDDWLGNYFDHGIDIRRRRVFLHGDVDAEEVAEAVQSIVLLDDDSDKEITLYLSSFGGCAYESFGLYDVIRSCRCHIVGLAYGKCMSAGPLVLRACDDALALPTTQFMHHEMSYDADGGLATHKVEIEHSTSMEKLRMRLLAKHAKVSAASLAAMARTGKNKYFDAEQALKWGIIDGIKYPDKIERRKSS